MGPIRCFFLATILAGNYLDFGSATTSVRLDLVFHTAAQENSLVCNDGSPGGYYFRPAAEEAAQDKWIFYLEGGGWCWNATSCEHRINSNGENLMYKLGRDTRNIV